MAILNRVLDAIEQYIGLRRPRYMLAHLPSPGAKPPSVSVSRCAHVFLDPVVAAADWIGILSGDDISQHLFPVGISVSRQAQPDGLGFRGPGGVRPRPLRQPQRTSGASRVSSVSTGQHCEVSSAKEDFTE